KTPAQTLSPTQPHPAHSHLRPARYATPPLGPVPRHARPVFASPALEPSSPAPSACQPGPARQPAPRATPLTSRARSPASSPSQSNEPRLFRRDPRRVTAGHARPRCPGLLYLAPQPLRLLIPPPPPPQNPSSARSPYSATQRSAPPGFSRSAAPGPRPRSASALPRRQEPPRAFSFLDFDPSSALLRER